MQSLEFGKLVEEVGLKLLTHILCLDFVITFVPQLEGFVYVL